MPAASLRGPAVPDAVLDAVIVGAGFSGLYMLYSLRSRGFSLEVLESAPEPGGTWYWNCYPGARCDVQSIEYSYSFSPEIEREWRWTERYAGQPEILRYLNFVADRLDLRRDIRFNTRVESCTWDERRQLWRVRGGDRIRLARFVLLASGNLSVPRLPSWPGLERFPGPILHTAQWPRGADVRGRNVAVVGTGSSGVQVIPQLARDAATLTVFQRTPSFIVPANNKPLTREDYERILPGLPQMRAETRQSFFGFAAKVIGAGPAKAAPPAERRLVLEQSWGAGTTGLLLSYGDLLLDEESNHVAAEFAREKIATLVKDPARARSMTPTGYPIGARRLVSEIGYFEAMNRPNVRLVDVREEDVVEVTREGIRTQKALYPIEVLVFATGFHAMTGAAAAIRIEGREGRILGEEWAQGPRAYLGLAVSGFPNLFTITGPGSPSVLSNMVLSIEQHVEWITDCLARLRDRGVAVIEATAEAEAAWMQETDFVASKTLFPRANSWYHGRTRDGRRMFMPYVGGVGAYRNRCAAVADRGYEGFTLQQQAAVTGKPPAARRSGA